MHPGQVGRAGCVVGEVNRLQPREVVEGKGQGFFSITRLLGVGCEFGLVKKYGSGGAVMVFPLCAVSTGSWIEEKQYGRYKV